MVVVVVVVWRATPVVSHLISPDAVEQIKTIID